MVQKVYLGHGSLYTQAKQVITLHRSTEVRIWWLDWFLSQRSVAWKCKTLIWTLSTKIPTHRHFLRIKNSYFSFKVSSPYVFAFSSLLSLSINAWNSCFWISITPCGLTSETVTTKSYFLYHLWLNVEETRDLCQHSKISEDPTNLLHLLLSWPQNKVENGNKIHRDFIQLANDNASNIVFCMHNIFKFHVRLI